MDRRVTGFMLRFLAAGLLVAALPSIAAHLGNRLAGVILLFPAVTLAGLLTLGMDRGAGAVAQASLAAIAALPAVGAFLLVVYITARKGLTLPWVLGMGVFAWLAAATIVAAVAARPGGPP